MGNIAKALANVVRWRSRAKPKVAERGSMEVLLDTREPIEFKLQAMAAGDVKFNTAFGQHVLVESKKVYQYIKDLKSGQLALQAQKMLAEADICIIALRGQIASSQIQMLRRSKRSMWLSGIFVEQLPSEDDSLYLTYLKELYQYFQELGLPASIMPKGTPPTIGALIFGVPGLGKLKAKALLATYGSLAAIADFCAEDIEGAHIPGIGRKLAIRIWQFFHERYQ